MCLGPCVAPRVSSNMCCLVLLLLLLPLLPTVAGFGAAMMGLMPGMAGMGAGGMPGMPGAMNPLGQMPGMRPGVSWIVCWLGTVSCVLACWFVVVLVRTALHTTG